MEGDYHYDVYISKEVDTEALIRADIGRYRLPLVKAF